MIYGAGMFRSAIVDGDVLSGSVTAGQSVCLVNDIVPAKALIDRLVAEAGAVICCNAAQITLSPGINPGGGS